MPRDVLGLPLLMYYPALAIILLGIALAAIPRAEIKRLFIESLLWGTGFSFIFTVAMRVLGIFRYEHLGPFQLLGSPIWLNLAWSPAILIFLFFRPPMRRAFLFWGYLLTFCLVSAMLNEVLSRLGLLRQYHWSSPAQFLSAAIWFLGAALFNERYMIRFYPDQPHG
ncbi:MAG: hypothetical protein ACM3XS_04700 [Bacteroidota bacterium]